MGNLYVVKRNGNRVPFEPGKIRAAIGKANASVPEERQMSEAQMDAATQNVAKQIMESDHEWHIEEIQDAVILAIQEMRAYEVATEYTVYRYRRGLVRQINTTDEEVLTLLDRTNQEAKDENSNKNPVINSTQRDYMAGAVSKDLTRRILLPKEVWDAHEKGIIHFHDSDYFAQTEYNCSLVNLEDMLQNGTVITETLIEKPHSFRTACNIATQVVAQVASNQYGGQTFTLAHLAPFVDISRKKFRREHVKRNKELSLGLSEDQIEELVKQDIREEIRAGIQTIQYQLITLMTCNGQAPFVSVFMYLDEVPEGQTRDDLALIIEEVLRQRMQGVKNEKGVWVTPAFPKLLYVLDEDNVAEGSKYWDLTVLAAKCTAKRMVPDYISAKKMRELKGDVYPCMGCVDGEEVVAYQFAGRTYVESFRRMWLNLANHFQVRVQPDGHNLYMDTPGVKIYDQTEGFVDNHRVIRNRNSQWLRITFSNGRVLTCTPDHPFETVNRGVVFARDLEETDEILTDTGSAYTDESPDVIPVVDRRAWVYGFILCDGSYCATLTVSVADHGEEDIAEFFTDTMETEFGFKVKLFQRERGKKGNYKDLRAVADGNGQLMHLRLSLASMFGGNAKVDRQIPPEVFSWDENAKLSFLAGIIDADGYINNTRHLTRIQIGSTNKELALQQAMLAQNLGMPAYIYLNHYKGVKSGIRYRVEFTPTEKLLDFIVSGKKKDREICLDRTTPYSETVKFVSKTELTEEGYSYDVTTASGHFTVSGIYSHNCRSFLTPDDTPDGYGNASGAKNYKPDEHKYYGRFNQGVVTINLVDVACSSNGDMEKFWEILEERLELCHRALRCRHERLLGVTSDVAPILWQHGAIARLEKGEKIDRLLYNGYSTISLGYAGLYEMCMRMTGKSHTDPEAKPFALAVMQKLNDKCAEWRKAENVAYSVYGTPMESTTYKFAKCLRRRFGIIKGVTDKDYITNSYHVHVTEEIDAFTKLSFESGFQQLSPGGAICYVEVPDLQGNIPAVLTVMQHIYENIMYAELNTKSDYCEVCGYDGEIEVADLPDGRLGWKCPNCGNTDQDKMYVTRRSCGYIGTQFWNQGRTQEIRDRVLHL